MNVRAAGTFAIATVLALIMQLSYSQSPSIATNTPTYRCGVNFDPDSFVGKTFGGTGQWAGMTPFYLEITFNADCSTTWRTGSGSPNTDGQWEQPAEGGILWEPVRNGASVYKAQLEADGTMRGIMAGRGGYRGTFAFRQMR